MRRLFALALASTAALLVACAQTPSAAVLAPNDQLVTQGIPPIPLALVDRVAKYTDFSGHRFVDWHPLQRQMLVAHRKGGDNLVQLYLLKAPLAEPEQLTHGSEPVSSASFEPRQGRYLVFQRSVGGDEAPQLHRLDLDTRQVTPLTSSGERHLAMAWLHGRSELLYSSVPLDRTAEGGRRSSITTTWWLMNPLDPGARRKVAELPGGGWTAAAVSRDDRQIAVRRYLSANESQVWLMDLATGQRRQVLPAPGEVLMASHDVLDFRPDGSGLVFASDRAGEFNEAMHLSLADGAITRISAHVPWDVAGGTASRDGRLLALQFNVEGRDELRLFDAATLKELPAPALPPGSVGTTDFHPARAELAFSLVSAQGPSQIYTMATGTGKVEQWTRAHAPAGIDTARFSESQVVRWTSFDGRQISGLLNRPPARFGGRRPVLIDIHGGPASQAKIGFLGRDNYFIEELGMVVIRPNVRGSRGFGKTFLALDDGMKREDSVKDIGALLDWIAKQGDLDAGRVIVTGGSYGGYMSLAVSIHHADRIAGAIDEVGISHFVTFLTNTESYRRDLRRPEYGDERDPAMREFLHRISPLTQAHRITQPLFVIQGRNDPRVPYTEAEQIVASARAKGNPVWYLRAENEGHGFVRKENADFRFYAIVLFMEMLLQR